MRVLAIFLLSGALTVAMVVARSLAREADKRSSALEKRLDGFESDLEALNTLVATNSVIAHRRPTCQPAEIAMPAPKAREVDDKSPSLVIASAPERDIPLGERAAAGDRDVEKLGGTMESNFSRQLLDQSWSAGAATEIRAKVVARLPKDSQLRSIECRESMCRLETSHHSEEAYQAFVNRSLTAQDFDWPGAMFFAPLHAEGSGEVTTVAYLMRPGYSPPYADEVN